MSPSDAPLEPLAARCATHPTREARGTCSRCGAFYCLGCVRHVFGQVLCATCAARPEINYLERFRLELWGRRDGWAWAVGGFSLVLGGFAVLSLWEPGRSWLALALGVSAGAGIAFFLGVRWAREVLLAAPLCSAALCLLGRRQEGATVMFVILFVAALSIYFDTRNRLFFQRPVSPERLQKLWHLRKNNPMARNALSLGLGGIFFPLFAPFAILCGAVGLRRVDPEAVPPIGRKVEAVVGLVLGVAVLLLWGWVVWSRLSHS